MLAGFALLWSGCAGSGGLYGHNDPKPPGASITHPSKWRLSGSIPNVKSAADQDVSTAAVSNLIHENTSIKIDLQKTCLFNAVFIHHGSMANGYCGRVAVLTSLDGRKFTQQLEAPGTREVTSLLIIKPVLARYVMLKAVRQGPGAWSVAEVYLQ